MKRIVILLVIVMLIFNVSACGRKAKEKKAEKIAEDMIEESMGGDVDVDIDEKNETIVIKTGDGDMVADTSENQKWPKDFPKSVPEIEGVNVVGTFDMQGALTVTFEECDEKKAKDYKDMLEKAGWNIMTEMDMDSDYILIGNKDKENIQFMWTSETEEGAVTYTVME
jgi:hypothetical protein